MSSNFIVVHGYNLWNENTDKNMLFFRCFKMNKNPCCPFRLQASWISEEMSFKIKSLHDVHYCSRSFKRGSILTYGQIANHFINEIFVDPK